MPITRVDAEVTVVDVNEDNSLVNVSIAFKDQSGSELETRSLVIKNNSGSIREFKGFLKVMCQSLLRGHNSTGAIDVGFQENSD